MEYVVFKHDNADAEKRLGFRIRSFTTIPVDEMLKSKHPKLEGDDEVLQTKMKVAIS